MRRYGRCLPACLPRPGLVTDGKEPRIQPKDLREPLGGDLKVHRAEDRHLLEATEHSFHPDAPVGPDIVLITVNHDF